MKIHKYNGKIKCNAMEKMIYSLTILFLYFYSYRYVLQYNSESTSPTYSNTPQSIQISKYIIMLVVILVFGLQFKRFGTLKVQYRNRIIMASIIIILAQGCILLYISFNAEYLKMLMMFGVILLAIGSGHSLDVTNISKIFEIFLKYCILYEIVQIVLYFINGRLPALGYSTGKITDVRFGGPWDDPNGFAILLAFYFPYIIINFEKMKKVVYILILLTMLILTWSLTGIACFFVANFIFIMTQIKNKKIFQRIVVCVGIIFIGVVIFVYKNHVGIIENLNYFIKYKQMSIKQHHSGWDVASELSLTSVLGINPVNLGGEIGIVRLLSYGGGEIVFLMIFLLLDGIIKLIRKGSKSSNKQTKAFLFGMVSYMVAFFLSLFNLPLMYSFSIFGLVSLSIVVANISLTSTQNEI